MENQSIGKNLIYQRKLKGYSQEKLSEKASVTVRTIQRIENGNVQPHLETIKLLAVGLDIPIDNLIVLENPKEEAIQTKWLLLMHGLPLLGLVLPLFNVLVPLFLWVHKREDNAIYDEQGKTIVNFHISMLIFFIIAFIGLLTIPFVGFICFILVIPFAVITILINIIRVLNQKKCYYPLALPILKKTKPTNALPTLLLVATLFLCSCQTKQEPLVITRLDGTTIQQDSLSTKIHQLMQEAEITGMAVSIFNEDTVTYNKTFGYKDYEHKLPLTDTTNIYGASFSKAVFGVLVMKLVEEKVIDLDTPLQSYLPKKIYEYTPEAKWHDNFSDLKVDSLYQNITARMCLSHTTGFINYRWFEPDQKLKVHFTPGSKYMYSGEGFIYLQVVLEKLLGQNLEEIAQEKLFKPLGMNSSSYKWLPKFEDDYAYGHSETHKVLGKDKDNEPRAGGTLETTAKDYTTFLSAVMQQKLISKASYKELFSSHIRIKSAMQFSSKADSITTANDDIALGYGLGWGVFTTPYGPAVFKEGHGSGFVHHSVLFPDAKKGIMIMTNSENGNSIFKELLEVALQDTYTPWQWENYIPYQEREKE